MTHLTDLQCSMYVDKALDAAAMAEVDQHLKTCDSCQQQLELHRNDQSLIVAALAIGEPEPVPAPVFLEDFVWRLADGQFFLAHLTGSARPL